MPLEDEYVAVDEPIFFQDILLPSFTSSFPFVQRSLGIFPSLSAKQNIPSKTGSLQLATRN